LSGPLLFGFRLAAVPEVAYASEVEFDPNLIPENVEDVQGCQGDFQLKPGPTAHLNPHRYPGCRVLVPYLTIKRDMDPILRRLTPQHRFLTPKPFLSVLRNNHITLIILSRIDRYYEQGEAVDWVLSGGTSTVCSPTDSTTILQIRQHLDPVFSLPCFSPLSTPLSSPVPCLSCVVPSFPFLFLFFSIECACGAHTHPPRPPSPPFWKPPQLHNETLINPEVSLTATLVNPEISPTVPPSTPKSSLPGLPLDPLSTPY
jgi:hypothetical protein